MIGMLEQRLPILTRLRVCSPRKLQKAGQSQKKYVGSKIKKVNQTINLESTSNNAASLI